ncbi:MAG: DNA repair protein RecN [Chloroflexota bacterium]|nr:DNA repair protein RecN [Chloroflexota bacterium]
MLLELTISDFAIIDHTSLHFEEGLNVLSGETGAGKSILIDALGAVLGTRVGSDVVRTGARAARVDALFALDDVTAEPELRGLVETAGLGADEPLLILSREIHATGRSIARVNGRPTTVAMLSSIGERLVDIHGQSEHLSLLRPAAQLQLLDRFAGTESLRTQVGEQLRAWRELVARIREIEAGARERAQRVDLLTFQVDEIERAQLSVGEREVLERERQVLANAERLRFDAATALAVLSGDDLATDASPGVLGALRSVDKTLSGLAQIDRDADSIAERATEALVVLEDLAADLRSYQEQVEGNPERLEAVEERIELIRSLARKYGGSIEEIIAYGEQAAAELAELTGEESDVDAMRERANVAADALGRLALELSLARRAAAARLSAAMAESIAALNMGRAEVSIEVTQRPDEHGVPVNDGNQLQYLACEETGIDQITFLLAPNIGETLKPLNRIASGGETARLMLALKSILSDVDETPTLVFDEIDVGVGGRSGQVVGERLSELADRHQVLVITHLAQIAAYGDAHFRIAKAESNGRVVSLVSPLGDEERIEELAAMLGGVPVTAASRANAEDLWYRVRTRHDQHHGVRR